MTKEKKILMMYSQITRNVQPKLLDRYPAKHVQGIISDSRHDLIRMIPQMPYIGEKNIWQRNFDMACMSLAVYRTMKLWHFSLTESAEMISDMFITYLQNRPKLVRMPYPWFHFSHLNRNALRKAAETSLNKAYPADWVFSYFEDNDQGCSFGVNITECAIQKFFTKFDAAEFVPSVCRLDHAIGKLFHLRFSRCGTLSQGASHCDFRWKQKMETHGWSTN